MLTMRNWMFIKQYLTVPPRAFTEHESHREPSLEFRRPGPSPWRITRKPGRRGRRSPEGAPLPAYVPEHDPEPATDHLSNALGVALGRFGPAGARHPRPGEGQPLARPAGGDPLSEHHPRRGGPARQPRAPAAKPLLDAFEARPRDRPGGEPPRIPRSTNFFELHRKMYENRPIHWPLSSEKRTFVAWVTIHRWDADTLRVLLADHLHPTLTNIEGELADLRAARDGADKAASRAAEKRLDTCRRPGTSSRSSSPLSSSAPRRARRRRREEAPSARSMRATCPTSTTA
jgi:hypothetical protein